MGSTAFFVTTPWSSYTLRANTIEMRDTWIAAIRESTLEEVEDQLNSHRASRERGSRVSSLKDRETDDEEEDDDKLGALGVGLHHRRTTSGLGRTKMNSRLSGARSNTIQVGEPSRN